jgi:preprotein translocase subunit YajC
MLRVVELIGLIGMMPAGDKGDAPGGPAGIFGGMWVPLIAIAVVFYFILYLPEKKRKAQREAQLKNMQRGDEVVTSGGIYGKVTALTDKTATIEIAPNVRIKVNRSSISPVGAEEPAKDKDKDKADEPKDNRKKDR